MGQRGGVGAEGEGSGTKGEGSGDQVPPCPPPLKTYNEVAGKQAQVQEVIASFCGLGN